MVGCYLLISLGIYGTTYGISCYNSKHRKIDKQDLYDKIEYTRETNPELADELIKMINGEITTIKAIKTYIYQILMCLTPIYRWAFLATSVDNLIEVLNNKLESEE